MSEKGVFKKLLNKNIKFLPLNGGNSGTNPFIPLNINSLIPGTQSPCSLYIKAQIAAEQEIKFVPYTKEGDSLEEESLALLESLGIRWLYFSNHDLEKVIAYLNNCLLILSGDDLGQVKIRLTLLTEHLQLTLRQSLHAPRLGPHVRAAHHQIGRIIQELQKDKQALGLIWEVLTTSYNLYTHSANVCLLAVAMMLFMQKGVPDSQHVGLAALFHDVGMTRLPQEIFFKTSPLTQEEWYMVKHHPEIGQRLLRDCPILPLWGLRLILEHHENADGSGYPQGLPLKRQHRWTCLLRVADAYDSLTHNNLYRPNRTPFAALKEMKQQQGPRGPVFDPQTLDNFIRFLGNS